jgi:hypothetical protein
VPPAQLARPSKDPPPEEPRTMGQAIALAEVAHPSVPTD